MPRKVICISHDCITCLPLLPQGHLWAWNRCKCLGRGTGQTTHHVGFPRTSFRFKGPTWPRTGRVGNCWAQQTTSVAEPNKPHRELLSPTDHVVSCWAQQTTSSAAEPNRPRSQLLCPTDHVNNLYVRLCQDLAAKVSTPSLNLPLIRNLWCEIKTQLHHLMLVLFTLTVHPFVVWGHSKLVTNCSLHFPAHTPASLHCAANAARRDLCAAAVQAELNVSGCVIKF